MTPCVGILKIITVYTSDYKQAKVNLLLREYNFRNQFAIRSICECIDIHAFNIFSNFQRFNLHYFVHILNEYFVYFARIFGEKSGLIRIISCIKNF